MLTLRVLLKPGSPHPRHPPPRVAAALGGHWWGGDRGWSTPSHGPRRGCRQGAVAGVKGDPFGGATPVLCSHQTSPSCDIAQWGN